MMRFARILVLLAAALWFVEVPEAFAGKIHLTPERLRSESRLIVVGKVESSRKEEKPERDGSRTAKIYLKVAVESVEKGDVKPGDVVEVSCWRAVKRPSDGIMWDLGNDFVPAVGGKARFFLERESLGTWATQWPNGVEALEGAAAMDLPLEPADAPPASRDSGAGPWPWPYVVGAAGMLGGVLAAGVFAFRGFLGRKGDPSQPSANADDAPFRGAD